MNELGLFIGIGVGANYAANVAASCGIDTLLFFTPLRRPKYGILDSYVGLSQQYTALDYLNLASSIVHNDSEGKGECADYAVASYKAYQNLVRQNGRKDLKTKIRLCSSNYTFENRSKRQVPHMFIEVKPEKDGSFIPYESVMETPQLDPFDTTNTQKYSWDSLDERMKIGGEANRFTCARTLSGTFLSYPTLRLFTASRLGFVQTIYHLIRDLKLVEKSDLWWVEYHANKTDAHMQNISSS